MVKTVKGPSLAHWMRTPSFWLLFLLLVGGAYRFHDLAWDFQQSFHPDERNILGAVAETKRETGYRVTFFAYGQLPVYLYKATGELLSTPAFLWNLFHGKESIAQVVYWAFLILVLGGAAWAFPRKDWKVHSFGVGAFLFLNLLALKFFNVFYLWFDNLHDLSLRSANLAIMTLVAAGAVLSTGFWNRIDWKGSPAIIAASTVLLTGILPFVLPEAVAHVFATLGFTLLVAGSFLSFSWSSRWGRLLVGLLSLWAILSSLPHAGRQYSGYGEAMIIGRWWSAFFSTATIAALYGFVKRAYGRPALALIAAGAFAFSAVSIEQAHYCITESFITFMFVMVLWSSYELAKDGSWRNYLLAGTAFGLAMAAKTSALYYVLMIVMAHLVNLSLVEKRKWAGSGPRTKEGKLLGGAWMGALLGSQLAAFLLVGWKFRKVIHDLFSRQPGQALFIWEVFFLLVSALGVALFLWGIKEFKVLKAQAIPWAKLAAAGGLSFFIFFLLCPWSLLDLSGFMGRQNYEWDVVSIADACYVLQFKDTPRYWYHLWNLIHVELWWPLGLAAVLGAVLVLARFLKGLFHPVRKGGTLPVPFLEGKGFQFFLPELLILSWFIPYFGFIGAWNTKFIRYVVPLVPAFCIFASKFLWDIGEVGARWKGLMGGFRRAAVVIVLGGSFLYSTAYMHIYTHLHPWLQASVWIYQHVPPGSTILTEEWDDGLPMGVDGRMDKGIERSRGPQEYQRKGVRVYELFGFGSDDTDKKKEDYIQNLQNGDYLSIASKKLWYTLTNCTPEFKPDGFNIYPVTSRYYRLLWSGLLGYKMVAEFHSFPTLFGWQHPDDMAEESFSVYDHPRSYIFKKVENVPPERIRKLLSSDDYVKGIDRERMRSITPENVDGFIAERRDFLEEKGLMKGLQDLPSLPSVLSDGQGLRPPPSKPEKPKEAGAPGTFQKAQVQKPITTGGKIDPGTRDVLGALSKDPVIEDRITQTPLPEEGVGYQWRAWITWVLLLMVLGWLALPLSLRVFSSFPSGAYSLSKFLGFFVFSWAVWFPNCAIHILSPDSPLFRFTFWGCWITLLLLGLLSGWAYKRGWKEFRGFWGRWGRSWMAQEGAFLLAFGLFTLIKIHIPHIHDPVGEGYNGGGEAGMDYGFLASVVRGETFPPQNMWMAGQPIGYTFYFGHLMMGVLTKTLGLVPAVTYNLALITLFAAIFCCPFGIAYGLSGRLSSGWIAGGLSALAGNPAGARQVLQSFQQLLQTGNFSVLGRVYDYFGPTRVIPFGGNSGSTINEFPYFSVLYGDMHAHTLAQPFAMLFIGLVASLYMAPAPAFPGPRREGWTLFAAALLLGGLAFLNTWEVPVWVLFLGLALLVKALLSTRVGALERGLRMIFLVLLGTALSLGWFLRSGAGGTLASILKMDLNLNALGGATGFLLAFIASGGILALVLLRRNRGTQGLGERLLRLALLLGGVLLAAGILWWPFFDKFEPQQNKIMWVKPDIRTSLWNYFNVHGFFLVVMGLSSLVALSGVLPGWIGKGPKRTGRSRSGHWMERIGGGIERFLAPDDPLTGMLGLGLASLLVLWGASWVHWAETPGGRVLCQAFSTLTGVTLGVALWYRDRWGIWMAFVAGCLLWTALLVTHLIPLSYGASATLGLGLFSVLWIAAFFHLGFSIRTFRDRGLSFAYFLVAFFFFVTGGLEIFVMSEYFGFGDGMRNNSMFKYGIVAWTLASIGAGVFLPKIVDVAWGLFSRPVKEALRPRTVLLLSGGAFLWAFLRVLLDPFLSLLDRPPVYFGAGFLCLVLVGLAFILERPFKFPLLLGGSAVSILFFFSGMNFGYGTTLGVLQRGLSGWSLSILLPVLLTGALLFGATLLWEGRKDLGQRIAVSAWGALALLLLWTISVYPVLATWRKCHGFTDGNRKAWLGYLEPRTLNGLQFISREEPADAAAIHFLNRRVPGQPCLVEFVGEGYNSWASRFSIFTGIPALMGWDGHVGEWVGARQGDDIRARFNATERIFRDTDPAEAKEYLDAYGVRLVMVGSVERHGVPGRKGGYPPEGLDKFKDFLPLIYRNPQVEIYYNPPAE